MNSERAAGCACGSFICKLSAAVALVVSVLALVLTALAVLVLVAVLILVLIAVLVVHEDTSFLYIWYGYIVARKALLIRGKFPEKEIKIIVDKSENRW